MGEWPSPRWVRRHALFAPVGICVITALLVFLSEPGQTDWRAGLKSAGPTVDLGILIYATLSVLVERVIRMWFWALDQRRQWREKWKEEIREELLEEGIERGREEGIQVGVERGRAEADREFEEWLERAREMGLDVDSVPRERA